MNSDYIKVEEEFCMKNWYHYNIFVHLQSISKENLDKIIINIKENLDKIIIKICRKRGNFGVNIIGDDDGNNYNKILEIQKKRDLNKGGYIIYILEYNNENIPTHVHKFPYNCEKLRKYVLEKMEEYIKEYRKQSYYNYYRDSKYM